MDVNGYRKNAESFLSKLDKEYYMHFSGQKSTLNVSSIYKQHSSLFERETVDSFKSLVDDSSGEEKKKNKYLLNFCTEGFMENQVKELVDKTADNEAKATVKIEGDDVPFRYSEIILSNEADKNKRDIIDDKRREKIRESFNGDLKSYWKELHLQANELGFSSYLDLFSFLKGIDLYELEKQMGQLIEKTAKTYEDNFSGLLKEKLDLDINRSRRSDMAYFKRGKEYDRYFKKENLVPLFRETMYDMGIDLEKQENIHLDVESRKNKSPRAFCSTVKVPSEIYLVVMPTGGQDDFEAMFHEGGHAEHFGGTSPDLDFEYRYLGDNAVTEGYAFTLEHLMQSRDWMMNYIGLDREEASEFVYFSNNIKLWFCRRYAGKLKYEISLHDGSGIEGKDEEYARILTESNNMQYFPENYLRDVDSSFYCANYIRAWMFEAQLKDYIVSNFGSSWFKNKKAGSFLRELWYYGQKYDPVEILNQIGFKDLDIGYLINSLLEGVKRQ